MGNSYTSDKRHKKGDKFYIGLINDQIKAKIYQVVVDVVVFKLKCGLLVYTMYEPDDQFKIYGFKEVESKYYNEEKIKKFLDNYNMNDYLCYYKI